MRRSSSVKSAIDKNLQRRSSGHLSESTNNDRTLLRRRSTWGSETSLTNASLTITYQTALTRRSSQAAETPPDAIEVCVHKPEGASLGLTLANLAEGGSGVLVTRLTPTVANAPVYDNLKGAIIHEIGTSQTGGAPVPTKSYRDASRLLQTADGWIRLKVTKAALPDGWTEHMDDSRETYYVHREANVRSRQHPAAYGQPAESGRLSATA